MWSRYHLLFNRVFFVLFFTLGKTWGVPTPFYQDYYRFINDTLESATITEADMDDCLVTAAIRYREIIKQSKASFPFQREDLLYDSNKALVKRDLLTLMAIFYSDPIEIYYAFRFIQARDKHLGPYYMEVWPFLEKRIFQRLQRKYETSYYGRNLREILIFTAETDFRFPRSLEAVKRDLANIREHFRKAVDYTSVGDSPTVSDSEFETSD